MANYQSNYTGAQIDSAISKIINVNFTGTEIENKLSAISTLQSNVSTLQTNMTTAQGDITTLQSQMSSVQSITTALNTYETTSIAVKGVTMYFYKVGRLVYAYANGKVTTAWATGDTNGITINLDDKWMPITTYQCPSLGKDMGTKLFILNNSKVLYHNNGDNFASDDRLRIYMTYISKV